MKLRIFDRLSLKIVIILMMIFIGGSLFSYAQPTARGQMVQIQFAGPYLFAQSTTTTFSHYTSLAEPYAVSTSAITITSLIISSWSAISSQVEIHNVSSASAATTRFTLVYPIKMPASPQPIILNFASGLYLSEGCVLKPSVKSEILVAGYK